MKTGRSEISPPQSGMTNWDAKLRRSVQICSIIGGAAESRQSFGEPAMRT